MKTHSTDFGFIALTIARIGRQLKTEYKVAFDMSINDKFGESFSVAIFEKEPLKCINSFFDHEYDNPRDFCDAVFAYCIEHDLFKVPMNIELVD